MSDSKTRVCFICFESSATEETISHFKKNFRMHIDSRREPVIVIHSSKNFNLTVLLFLGIYTLAFFKCSKLLTA